jgi:uncharacterized damage-inducible protein DinB
MTNPNELAQSFETTHRLIHRFADGLTHEQSVLQLPFQANCFNWVLGHIVVHRDKVLKALDEPPTLNGAEAALYETGSEPITNSATAVPLSRLMDALDEAQTRITAALHEASPDMLGAIYNQERQQTVGERIAGLHWHETYHLGQLEILRELAHAGEKIRP